MTEIALSPWLAVPAAALLICGGLLTLIGLFGFVGSTALAKFLLRGEVIEP